MNITAVEVSKRLDHLAHQLFMVPKFSERCTLLEFGFYICRSYNESCEYFDVFILSR